MHPCLVGVCILSAVTVVDGDTLRVGDTRIRIIGIDSPEPSQTCKTNGGLLWKCGLEASKYMKQMVAGHQLQCSPQGTDYWNRILAMCGIVGTDKDIGREMVDNGWALLYKDYPPYQDSLESAKENKFGIWAGQFIDPYHWRKGKRW